MRRSAAPSQMTGSCGSVPSAKRQKFVAPVYRPYHGSSSSNQTTHCQSQNDSVRCKDNKDKVDLCRSSSSLDARSTLPSVIPRQTSLFNKVIKDNASVNAQTCLRRASGDNDNHKNGSFCLQDSAGGRNDASLPSSCSNEVERDISTITSLTRRTVKRNEECPSAINLENVSPATDHGSCLHPQDSVVPLQPHQGETMPLPLTDAHNTLNEKKEISSSTSSTRYFSVVWCKLSKKKHKKWEGDAILSTSGRSAILYDTEGKIIGRGSGYKIAELESLKEDETLVVGGKEIQVMSLLTEEQFKSGKCFSDASASVDHSLSTVEASGTVRSSGVSKPFSNPLLKSGQHGKQFQVNNDTVNKQSLVPRYDPSAPDALVMPRPSPDHQWKHNKHGQAVVDVVVDPYLSTSLRSHQRTGVVFLYECIMGMRDYYGQGAILADDMGLGKTLQCISLIWTLLKQGPYGGQPVVKKVLVVTPGSLVKNWFLEFKKWLGTERLNVFAVAADKRVDDFVKSTLHPVLVISYEMFVRCHEVIKEVPFDLIICDEGHRLKNTAIKTTSLIMSLPCRKRIVLTGTPVQNDLQEFYSIVEFCNPGILGSSAAFRRVYEEPIVASRQPKASAEQQELGMERAQELTRLTQMFVLRRTQEINNDYLPPKVELVLFCRPTSLQLSIYRQLIRSSVIRRCLAGNLAGSPHLICIGALKQLCNHPGLVYRKAAEAELKKEGMQAHSQHGGLGQGSCDRWEDSIYDGLLSYFPDTFDASTVSQVDSGKLEVLSGLLSAIFAHSSSEKVVLVSNHTKTLDFLQVFCDLHGYSYLRLDGGTPTSQRQDVVNRFNNNFSPHRVFLLSSKAGGVGLNLIGASRLILYDIDWNPANDLQAMARVWRDGQKRKVHIYRLLTVGTIEEKIYQRQITKQGLSGAVMDLSNKNDVQFSLEDLKDLFSLNEKTACETHSMLDCHCEGDPALVHEKPTTEAVAEDRQCQLGIAAGVARKNRVTNLTMAKLLHWNHWRGEFVSSQKAWYLDAVGPLLSFVFWHETSEN